MEPSVARSPGTGKRAAAPRKKRAGDAPAKELRGTKLSSPVQVCNPEKYQAVARMLDRVLALKQRMSADCHAALPDLFLDPYGFKARYKAYASPDLNAWERQALFHDIVGDYQRALEKRAKNAPFVLQAKEPPWRYEVYRRAVARLDGAIVAKGAVKPGTFVLRTHKKGLARFANYLLRRPFRLDEPFDFAKAGESLRPEMEAWADRHPALWLRLLTIVSARRERLLARVKPIHYTTGTHRRHPAESSSGVVCDPNNAEYQWWLKVRMGNTKQRQSSGRLDYAYAWLPLLYSQRRFTPDELMLGQEFRLKAGRRKLHACLLFEAPEAEFKPESHIIGADANTKHNLLADSEGGVFDYDRLWLDSVLAVLTKWDAVDKATLTHRQTSRLARWIRANEGALKKRLSEVLDVWEAAGVTDVVLEDLSLARDATWLRHEAFGIKYSRLARLLRLSNLKKWLGGQAEKRGIRVHVTHAAYSSQECPECHHVARSNRKTQEVFCCEECGYTAPADNVAGRNLKHRLVSDVLRPALHGFDVHGRATPKPMSRTRLKAVLSAQKTFAGPLTDCDEWAPTASRTQPSTARCVGSVSGSAGPLTDLHGPASTTKVPAASCFRLIEAPPSPLG